MKHRLALLSILFIVCAHESTLFAQNWNWIKREGNTGLDQANSICTDVYGNCYVASSNAVSRYNPGGTLMWRDSLSNQLDAVALCWAYNRLYVLCDSAMQHLICPYDLFGNEYPSFYGTGGGTGDIAADGQGNLYVSSVFGVGISKIDTTGSIQWMVYPIANITDICLDALGNIYITGMISQNATFGTFNLICDGYNDIFVAKYDPAGTCIWARDAGAVNTSTWYYKDQGNGIAVDANGNVYVTGQYVDTLSINNTLIYSQFPQDNELFLAKWDNNGNFQWAQVGGGWWDQIGEAVVVNPQGNVLVTGRYVPEMYIQSTQINGWGDYDAFVAEFNPAGTLISTLSAGGPLWNEVVQDIAISSGGNIFVCGTFYHTAYFGTDSLVSAGSGDVFVAQIDIATTISEVLTETVPSIFPNPCFTDQSITFQFSTSENRTLVIYDVMGNEVLRREFYDASYVLSSSQFAAGTYLYSVIDESGEVSSGKFISQ